jgi:hypothetical protein
MTLLKEPRSSHSVTGSYELLKDGNTKLYDYQPEDKALAMALSAHSAAPLSRSRTTAIRPDTIYKSDFDEDTLIISEPAAVRSSNRVKKFKRRNKPSHPRRRAPGPRKAGVRFAHRKMDGRKMSVQPKAPAIIQFYKGFVETVREGLAYLALESRTGQRVQIEWDEAELAEKNIGERQPFILKTITEGNQLKYEFILDRLRPLSDDLRDEIDALRSHYRAAGALDDDDD